MKALNLLRAMLCIALTFVTSSAFAGTATWQLNPGSGDWNTATNWTPNTVPNGPADQAIFLQSNVTAISLSSNVEVDSMGFASPGSSFTFTINPDLQLTLSGGGIHFN